MNYQIICRVVWLLLAASLPLVAEPVIDPIPPATIPLGNP